MLNDGASMTREISRGIIAIYKDYMGRGPSDAYTELTENSAITTVTGSMTKAERSLVADGKGDIVRNIRRIFQESMRNEISGVVENATGRKTGTFLSDHDVEADIAIEVVLFMPKAADGSEA